MTAQESQIAHLRVPPHSIEAEQSVIGGLMLDSSRLDTVREIVTVENFYRREHRVIFEVMLRLADARKAGDVLTVTDALADAGNLEDAGGLDYLGALVTNIHSAANIVTYARIVKERAVYRRMISVGHSLADLGFNGEGDLAERLAKAQEVFAALDETSGDDSEPEQIDGALRDSIRAFEHRFEHKGQMFGLPTGFPDLDGLLMGLVDGDLIVVAGRPSMGKTTMACNIAENVALKGGLVILFSLEMSKRKVMDRMLCSLAKVDAKRYRLGELHDDEIDRVTVAAGKLRGAPYYVDDSSLLTSGQLLSRARRIARKLGQKPALVVVDYMQILRDKGEGHERVTKISANLKQAARELSCPVIALSQLNRQVENRAKNDRRPVMSDLRDSGSVEQDADVILMLYRDEVYNEETMHKGVAEAIVRKNRDGELGTVYLSAPLSRNRFEPLTQGWRPAPEPVARRQQSGNVYGD